MRAAQTMGESVRVAFRAPLVNVDSSPTGWAGRRRGARSSRSSAPAQAEVCVSSGAGCAGAGAARTRIRAADPVGVVEEKGVVYVAPLPTGPIVVLTDAAAVIWAEALSGDSATFAERVAARTDRTVPEIAADVEAFVQSLIARGLLENEPS